jgi:hypothetical protein
VRRSRSGYPAPKTCLVLAVFVASSLTQRMDTDGGTLHDCLQDHLFVVLAILCIGASSADSDRTWPDEHCSTR